MAVVRYVVVDSLFIVVPIVCGCSMVGPCFCYTVSFSTFAIILLVKRELVALL